MQAELFADANTVTVHQSKGLGEVLSGIGRGNRFTIDFGDQASMLLAEERGDKWRRAFLGSLRTYELVVQQRSRKPVLQLRSAFRFFGRSMQVMSADGQPLGQVRRRFASLRTRYDVLDARGKRRFEIL